MGVGWGALTPALCRKRERGWVGGLVAVLVWVGLSGVAAAEPVVWAWERSEALGELPASYGIAVVVGVIRLSGEGMVARGRRFPLRAGADAAPIGVVHIEIDRSAALDWTDRLRAQVVEAALSYASGYRMVQIDMEVRRSEREALLDVLRGVRAGLAPGTVLSMTALASWCESERWLEQAPVDEIVPMLFRMGRQGGRLREKLAAGGDFGEPRCRTAVGISLDAPVTVPPGRRIYVFNPRAWDAAAVAALESRDLR